MKLEIKVIDKFINELELYIKIFNNKIWLRNLNID